MNLNNDIIRLIISKLQLEDALKFIQIGQYNKLFNDISLWKSLFANEFPEHIDMIELDRSYSDIKHKLQDLWIYGAFFTAHDISSSHGSLSIYRGNVVCKQTIIHWRGTKLIIYTTRYRSRDIDTKRTNETTIICSDTIFHAKLVKFSPYTTYVHIYPKIFVTNNQVFHEKSIIKRLSEL